MVVTLDRVICCYPLYQPLLKEALRHAERYFAYSYPRDVWYVHAAIAFGNAIRRIRANPFRAFVHPVKRMTHVIQSAGFKLVSAALRGTVSSAPVIRRLSIENDERRASSSRASALSRGRTRRSCW